MEIVMKSLWTPAFFLAGRGTQGSRDGHVTRKGHMIGDVTNHMT